MAVPVNAQGPGLVKAIVDQTADFLVDTNGLRGSLQVQVDGTAATLVSLFIYFINLFITCNASRRLVPRMLKLSCQSSSVSRIVAVA